MGAISNLFALLFFAVAGIAPLIAATFVGRRMGYRGLGLIVPWIVAVAIGLVVGFALGLLDRDVPEVARAPVTSFWSGGILISGYLTTLGYLIVLAIRRLPTRPADTAAVF